MSNSVRNRHIFIIGSRGLPAQYGGFETFVSELVCNTKNPVIKFHVACLSDSEKYTHFSYAGADCYKIKPPKIGSAQVIFYDMLALRYAIKLCKQHHYQRPIFYILGNTVGTFVKPFAKKIHQLGGLFYVNPDGLEWKRSKWAPPIQHYLKYSEKKMVKEADLVVCDNLGIQKYIEHSYPKAKTKYIAYGTHIHDNTEENEINDATNENLKASSGLLDSTNDKVRNYFTEHAISEHNYYLVVGRFVPENNYETIIREFMLSETTKNLVIITDYRNSKLYNSLSKTTSFQNDPRIKFLGTLYDRDLLQYLRENAYAYIHGHEVGGTNPSLLEALSATDVNLLLDVSFNRNVAADTALYWDKNPTSLSKLINKIDTRSSEANSKLGQRAIERMKTYFTWPLIVQQYEEIFLR